MNPLMQAMAGSFNAPRNNFSQIVGMIRALQSGNPQQMFQNMMQNNPQFRQFMEANKGKDPMQVAKEHGIDLEQIKSMM